MEIDDRISNGKEWELTAREWEPGHIYVKVPPATRLLLRQSCGRSSRRHYGYCTSVRSFVCLSRTDS